MKLEYGIFIFSLMLLAGCSNVPFKDIEEFSKTSNSVALEASYAITRLDESDIEYQLSTLVNKSAKDFNAVKFDDFVAIKGVYGSDLANKHIVVKGTSFISSYAQALQNLASEDVGKNIDKSAKEVYEAMQDGAGTYKEVTGKDLTIEESDFADLATIVSGLARIAVDVKREKAIRKVVKKADEPLSILCDAMIKQINIHGIILKTTLDSSFQDQLMFLKADYNKMTTAEKNKEIRDLYSKALVLTGVQKEYDEIEKSLMALKTTHNAMYEALMDDDIDFDDFKQRLKSLNGTYKELRSFSKKLEKS